MDYYGIIRTRIGSRIQKSFFIDGQERTENVILFQALELIGGRIFNELVDGYKPDPEVWKNHIAIYGDLESQAEFFKDKDKVVDYWAHSIHKAFRQTDVTEDGALDSLFWNVLHLKGCCFFELFKDIAKQGE